MDNVHWTWPTKLVAADVGVDRRGIICLFVKAIFNAHGSIKARGIPVGVTCVSPMGWAMGNGQCPLDMAHQVGCSRCGR